VHSVVLPMAPKRGTTLAMRLLAILIAWPVVIFAQTPVINSVVSQASLTTPVSPGMPILVNGAYLAGGLTDCPGPIVPLTCGSVSVSVNNRPAPVRIVHPNQVVTYIPADQSASPVSVILRNHQSANSAPFTVDVAQYAPGIQKLSDASGSVLGFFSDASQRVINRANPASPGKELTVYAVGLGPTIPSVPTGEIGSAPVTTVPALWVGARSVPVVSAGLGCGALCDPGNYLVRFLLPADTPTGDQPVFIEIAGRRSSPATLVVGPPVSGPAVGFLQSVLDDRVRTMAPGMVANVVGGGFMSLSGGVGPCAVDPSFWPTRCQGVTVTINGRQAAMQLVTPNFLTIQIPFELTPGPATLVVDRTVDGQTLKSAPFNLTLNAVSPTLPANPQSPYAGVVIENSGGVATTTNPLLPGDTIFLYADGLGQTNPPMVTGFSLIQPARTVLTPSVTVGGKPLQGVVAEVLPGMIGQYRVTASVPAGISPGDLPIVLEIGGKKSQDGLLVPVANQPVIAAVTNSASGARDIVSGSWVSIYGRNLSASRREWTEDDIIYDWLPTVLDGVDVAINNTAAVIAFVSPTQLNVLCPDDLPPGPVEVTVKNSLGWQKTTAYVKAFAPGLFPLQVPPGIYLLALHADWAYVARSGQLSPNVAARPAQPRETIVFYGTGFGRTNPEVSIYHRFSGSAPLSVSVPVRVQIGAVQAEVVYVGLVGNGLYQLNVVVPDLPDGDHEVILSVGAEASLRGRYIPVKR
jgi:uncharacterized protein (TIGR03437 family)